MQGILRDEGKKIKAATLAGIGALLASFVAAYYPVWKDLVHTWNTTEEYSHGFFVVPICIYLVWKKRQAIQRIGLNPARSGLAIVLLTLATYVFANHAKISTLASLSLVLFLAGLILYLFGFAMLRVLLFPLSFLLFMIPIPTQIYSSLTLPLQLFVTNATVWIGTLIGTPIYNDGNVIYLPRITLQVVEACSGLRTMVSLLMLSALLGHLTLRSNVLRSALFLSGVPVAIIVNILRVLLIAMAMQYFNINLTIGVQHTVVGLMIFGVAISILYFTRCGLAFLEPQ